MMEFLLIVLLIAAVAVLALLATRSRRHTENALPADDLPDDIGPGASDETAMVPPPSDITVPSNVSSPLPPEPQPVEQSVPEPEPEVVAETVPPVEPEPVVEPVPPAEPEPVIEPEPEPVEPEPVIEPDTADVSSAHDVHPAADPDEPTDPPQAVIDAGELPAQELDPHAGWETDGDRTIHADPESGLYHTPDSPGYKIGPDGQIFETEEEAQSAGFTRWDELR
jgi:outer membrane biosynthesis protein TonB